MPEIVEKIWETATETARGRGYYLFNIMLYSGKFSVNPRKKRKKHRSHRDHSDVSDSEAPKKSKKHKKEKKSRKEKHRDDD